MQKYFNTILIQEAAILASLHRKNIAPRHIIARATLATALLSAVFAPISAEVVKAHMADSLVESIGVCTHVGYAGTPYVTNFPAIKQRLAESGIRYIRDAIPVDGRGDGGYEYMLELCKDVGIKTSTIFIFRVARGDANYDTTKIAAEVERVAASPFVEHLFALEGPNEPDHSHNMIIEEKNSNLVSYQKYLYRALKANPALKHLPVLGPSMLAAHSYRNLVQYGVMGDLTDKCDIGNIHSYPGAAIPEYRLGTWWIKNAAMAYGDKPLWCTETGYHNALNNKGSHVPIDEANEAKYLPRLYLTYFMAGIGKTFSYELVDEANDSLGVAQEQSFGMLRYDCSPKPAFTAIKNLIGLLKDQGATHTTGSLAYTIATTDRRNIQSCLFQKRNGQYLLAIWQEVESWNRETLTPIINPTRKVTIQFQSPVSGARIFHPTYSSAAISTIENPEKLELDLPDHVVMIELNVPTHTIESASITVAEDAYVNGSGATTSKNYGDTTVLLLRQPFENRLQPFWKFDLSDVPSSFLSATLRIPAQRLNITANVDIYLVDDSWTEAGLTWKTKPDTGALIGQSTMWSTPVVNEIELDITEVVRRQISGNKLLGITMNCEESRDFQLFSKESGNGAYIQIVKRITNIGDPVGVGSTGRKSGSTFRIEMRGGRPVAALPGVIGMPGTLSVFTADGRLVFLSEVAAGTNVRCALPRLGRGTYLMKFGTVDNSLAIRQRIVY